MRIVKQQVTLAFATAVSLACSDAPTSFAKRNLPNLVYARHVFDAVTVSVTPGDDTLMVGQSVQLVATALDKRGKPVSDVTFTWATSDPAMAAVSASGVVTAKGKGNARVTAALGSSTGTSQILISDQPPAPVASVTVALSASSLYIGQSGLATATLTDASGATLSGRTVTWQSSNPAVAAVSSSGAVSALGAGTTQISATSEGLSGAATLSVTVVPVASVTVTLGSSSLNVGQTTQASATLRDASGNVLSGRGISWSSDNSAIASVNGSGVVTGLSGGSASISATSEGQSGSASLTVVAPAPPPPPPPPPSGSSPEPAAGDVILWQDNFDARTDLSGYAQRGVLSLVTGRGGAGKAVRFSYSPTSDDNLIEKAFAPTTNLYVRYWYRVNPAGALPYAGRTGSGLKWFLPQREVAPRYTCGTSLLEVAPGTPGYPSQPWEFGCHDNSSTNMPSPNGQNVSKTPRFNTTNDGGWHKYTIHIVTGNGGYEQIWVDGVLIVDTSPYGWNHAAEGISYVQFPGLVVDGIPDSSWNFQIEIDDFAIWHK